MTDDFKIVYLSGIGLKAIGAESCRRGELRVKSCRGGVGLYVAVREYVLRPSGEYTRDGYEIWR